MIKSGKTKIIIWQMIFYVMLGTVYVHWISPIYAYTGFQIKSANYVMGVISFVTVVIMSAINALLIERGEVGDNIILLISLLYFFPQSVLYVFCIQNTKYYLFSFVYCLMIYLFDYLISKNNVKKLLNEKANIFEVLMLFLGVSMIAISGSLSGFRISFNMSDYYEFRFAVRELSMPSVLKYILNWARALLPIGLTYGIINKKKIFTLFIAVSLILCFSFDGKKSALFMFILAIITGLFFDGKYIKKMPIFMVVLCCITLIESKIRNGQSFLGKHIIRRMMFIPPYIGGNYYDYFQTHEYDYLRGSILRWFGLKTPYPETIPRLIGRVYSLSSANAENANTGLCGDAFANFGWLSLAFYPLMFVWVIKIISNLSEKLDMRLKFIISITVAYSFLSGSFFSVLLTNGILILIILLITIPENTAKYA